MRLAGYLAGSAALVLAASCGAAGTDSLAPASAEGPDAAAAPQPVADASAATYGDPFAPQPDESEGLTNVSSDLDAVLERGALANACAHYRSGQTDRKTMLLCGKWMYFYESFGTLGVPSAIVKFLAQNFPDELGIGFSKLGMVLDPSSADKLPLGMGPTNKIEGKVDALAFTCASCHFGRLPDGRYAVGAPNHEFDYGTQILAMTLAPGLGLGTGNPADHDPSAVAKVQPLVDRLKNDTLLRAKFGLSLLPLLSLKQPGMTKEIEGQYASWPPGTMDFVIAPLPMDDHVHVVGKMIGLWGIPRKAEQDSAGMKTALLGWAGQAKSLEEFVSGFATLGGVAPPTPDEMKPILEYIYSLRAPANPSPPDATLVAEGASLFANKGCAGCHDGPRGSGRRSYTFDEIGTDRALSRWADPNLTGTACCGLEVEPGSLQHGVKSPRLVGQWALRRFLHNGSLRTLEQLFCLDPRPTGGVEPFRADGHSFTCDGLGEHDKYALIAFLESN